MVPVFRFKPDAGRLLVSPAEETDVEPHDAYADDEALAEGIERIAALTTIEVLRAPRAWAGLRTFSIDRLPVIGFAPAAAPFFWLAGQGGSGSRRLQRTRRWPPARSWDIQPRISPIRPWSAP
jgi:D-arginine dehydrogenase